MSTPEYSDVTFVFTAGRYDATPARVGEYARDLIDAHAPSVLVTTETYNRGLGRAIRRRLPRGWVARRQGEYMVAWDKATIRAAKLKPRVRRMSWRYLGRDAWRDARVASRHLIVRETGARIILDAAHLQAGVEAGAHWRIAPWPAKGNVAGHRDATRRWGDLIRRRKARWPQAGQVAFMDSNLNQRLDVWRQYLVDQLGLPSIWSGRLPQRGTHAGRRLIDTCHTNVQVLGRDVSHLDPPAGMDHTAFWCRLRIPAPKKKV